MKKVQKTADRLLFYAYSPDVLIYTADGHCTSQHIDNTYAWLYNATTNTWWVGSNKGVAQQIAFESEQSNAPYSIVTPNILPNSPRSNHFARIKVRNATLYSVPGRGTGELPGAVQVWDGDNWTFFDDTFAETLSYKSRGTTHLSFLPMPHTSPCRAYLASSSLKMGSCGAAGTSTIRPYNMPRR